MWPTQPSREVDLRGSSLKMYPNVMFDHITWIIGMDPMMILDGKNRRLDAVAETNLDLPAFGPYIMRLEGILMVFANDESYETRFGLEAPHFLSCWDFILSINEYFDDLIAKYPQAEGKHRVNRIRCEGNQVIVECGSEIKRTPSCDTVESD